MLVSAAWAEAPSKRRKGSLIQANSEQAVAEILSTANETRSLTDRLSTNQGPARAEAERQIAQNTQRINQTVDRFPESPVVQDAGAQAALQLGDLRTAGQRAETAVQLAAMGDKPDGQVLARSLVTRALVRAAGGDYKAAEADAQRALKAEPGNAAAEAVYKLAKDKGLKEKTVAKPDSSGKLTAFDGEVRAAIDFARAQSALTRPEGFAASVAKTKEAETGLKLDDYERMRDAATAALKKLPNNPRAYMDRAFANLMMKDYDAVIADCDAGLKLKPDSYALLALRAAAFLESGRAREALADASKAVALNPKDAFSRAQRGLAQERLGAPEASYLADLKEAAELDPSFDRYYTEALARRDGGGAPGSPKLTPWWASARTTTAGLGLLFVALGVCVILLLKPAEQAPKDVIGGCFKLGKQVGAGGMGAVFEAWDRNLERWVAVKRMSPALRDDAQESARFIQEAKTVASLKHPNIVAIYDAFQDAGELYLVFELVKGETLDEHVARQGGSLPLPKALELLAPLCDALDYAHKHGVIHRDLKPNNVMIEDGRLKVMDFGIARRTRSKDLRTRTDVIAGTPAYMAPEQDRGEVSKESDLYALGIVAYWMLSGRRPFDDGFEAKRAGRFQPLGGPKDPVFARALAPEPEDRFHAAAEFFAALRDA